MALSLVASLEGKIQNNENSFMAQSAAYDVQKKRGGGRYLTGKIRHRALAAVSAVADAVDGRPLR